MAKAKKQTVSAHDLDRIIVRLPEGMREKIAALAEANGRSMTAEVVAALDQHLKGPTALQKLEQEVGGHDRDLSYLAAQMEVAERAFDFLFDHLNIRRPPSTRLEPAFPDFGKKTPPA